MRHLFRFVAAGTLAVAILVTIVSLGTLVFDNWWIGELFSHPRPHYALALFVCLPVLVIRYRRTGWLVLLPLLINILPILPLYQSHPAIFDGPKWTVLHYNLDLTASNHASAME